MPHVHGMGTMASCLPSWMCSGCWSANKVLAKWGMMAQCCGELTYLGVSEGEAMGCHIVVPLLPVSQQGRLGRWGGDTYEHSEIHNDE